ncbi:brain-enriched guanylate kinase-associated protein isoform X2 [Crotalus tigris]|uniref:brain-enriched guanylate kinase-associated protein isoform X2 n=1 Tax=Crotalus tigris TaxID=88082 RepID=UPI00192F82EB|nr:brain-enriched guanylate kinase-associated protein isoform X2 [Crotalus tigris]
MKYLSTCVCVYLDRHCLMPMHIFRYNSDFGILVQDLSTSWDFSVLFCFLLFCYGATRMPFGGPADISLLCLPNLLNQLPAEFQERVSLHLEKHGCSLSVPLCHTSFADNIPTCVIAKVLEKPDPNNLSPHMSSPSSRDLAFQESLGKLGQRPQYKSDIYCSDTALYCPEERRRERRQSVDMQVKGVGFLRSQNSTDSTVEEDGFHSSFSHEAFPEYVTSLPTSSSYSSFSVTSEEKENVQGSTLTASQQAIYLSSRDEMFERKPSSGYEQGSPRFAKTKSIQHMELADDNENSPTFTRTMSPYASEPYHFSAITTQQALASQKMRSESRNSHLSEEDLPGQWRQLSVEDIGAYSYRNSGRLSPCSFSEQYYRSPIKKGDSRSSPIYASYKGDSFSEGDDICQNRLVDSCFLRTDSGLNIDISTSCKQDKLPSYKTKELRDKKSERITVQICSSKSIDGSPVLKREYVDVSPNSSAESLNHSSMEASDIHQSSIEQGSHSSLHSKQQHFQRTGSTGLSRKDSLTKAQLYGTLLN